VAMGGRSDGASRVGVLHVRVRMNLFNQRLARQVSARPTGMRTYAHRSPRRMARSAACRELVALYKHVAKQRAGYAEPEGVTLEQYDAAVWRVETLLSPAQNREVEPRTPNG
jgi:hypothetical protein